MPVVASCPCGAQFKAKDELAGKQVKCPTCSQAFTVPQLKQPVKIPVSCACGKVFQAKPQLAGKRVSCPACQQVLEIPVPAQPNPVDPLGVNSSDPLGLSGGFDESQANPLPSHSLSSPLQSPAPSAPKQRANISGEKTEVASTVIAILCIIHGLGRIGIMWGLFALLLNMGAIFSLGAFIGLATTAISVAIAAAGVGILTKQEWALQVGSIAAAGHFGLVAISFFLSIISLSQSPSGFGSQIFIMMIPRLIAESIVPGLLLWLASKKEDWQ